MKSRCLKGLTALVLIVLPLALVSCRRLPEETAGRHVGLGRAHYRQGDFKRAEEMFLKALELDPASADAVLNLAILYDDVFKDRVRAERYYRLFLEREPSGERARQARRWLSPAPTPAPVSRAPTPPPPPVPPRPTRTPRPSVPPRPPVFETYTAVRGDTLAAIAGKVYGDRHLWSRIYQANRDLLPHPDSLRPGQVLKIPPRP